MREGSVNHRCPEMTERSHRKRCRCLDGSSPKATFFSPVFIFLSHDIHLLSVFLCVVNKLLILITFVLMPTEHVYGFSL